MMKRLAHEASLQGQPGAFAGSLMNSSADLVARACEGDQEAFRLIFERYSRPLISFVYDQVGNRELAEELTQETFVRAYRRPRSCGRCVWCWQEWGTRAAAGPAADESARRFGRQAGAELERPRAGAG